MKSSEWELRSLRAKWLTCWLTSLKCLNTPMDSRVKLPKVSCDEWACHPASGNIIFTHILIFSTPQKFDEIASNANWMSWPVSKSLCDVTPGPLVRPSHWPQRPYGQWGPIHSLPIVFAEPVRNFKEACPLLFMCGHQMTLVLNIHLTDSQIFCFLIISYILFYHLLLLSRIYFAKSHWGKCKILQH